VRDLALTLKDLIPDYNPSAQLLSRFVDASNMGRRVYRAFPKGNMDRRKGGVNRGAAHVFVDLQNLKCGEGETQYGTGD
jgi:hypothetical protein